MKKVTTLLRGFFLLVCCLAIASLATAQNGQWGQWCYKDYSSSGTFTVPSHCTKITVATLRHRLQRQPPEEEEHQPQQHGDSCLQGHAPCT